MHICDNIYVDTFTHTYKHTCVYVFPPYTYLSEFSLNDDDDDRSLAKHIWAHELSNETLTLLTDIKWQIEII